MKILWSYDDKERYGLPNEIPDEMLNDEHAHNIHSQSLIRLNQRGGMSVTEIICNIYKYDFRTLLRLDKARCTNVLKKLYDNHTNTFNHE